MAVLGRLPPCGTRSGTLSLLMKPLFWLGIFTVLVCHLLLLFGLRIFFVPGRLLLPLALAFLRIFIVLGRLLLLLILLIFLVSLWFRIFLVLISHLLLLFGLRIFFVPGRLLLLRFWLRIFLALVCHLPLLGLLICRYQVDVDAQCLWSLWSRAVCLLRLSAFSAFSDSFPLDPLRLLCLQLLRKIDTHRQHHADGRGWMQEGRNRGKVVQEPL